MDSVGDTIIQEELVESHEEERRSFSTTTCFCFSLKLINGKKVDVSVIPYRGSIYITPGKVRRNSVSSVIVVSSKIQNITNASILT